MGLIADVFNKLRISKTLLDKYLKSRVSEGPSTSNMINAIKQSSYLNDTTFTKFIDHCEGN